MYLFNLNPISRLFLTISLVLFTCATIKGQYFEKVYGKDPNISGVLFALTSDHGIVILGNAVDSVFHTNGYYIFKADSNGTVVWQKKIIDAFNAYSYSITTLKDDKIVVLGTHTGVLYPIVAEVLVLDSNGNFFNSSVFPPFNGWGTAGVALANSSDSSVSITLYNDGFISNNYYSIFSLNPDLTTKWSDFVSFDGSYTNAHGISSNPDEYVYTISYYEDYFYSVNQLFRVTSIVKHDETGAILLDSIYEFNCVTTAVSTTKDGGAIVCGIQDTSFQRDMVLIRLDSIGNVLWQKQYGSNLDEEANTVIETADHGFALLSTIADPVIPGQHDLLLLKTNAGGDSLWSRKFGGILDERGLHMEEENTDIIILGSTTSFNDNLIYLIKTDSSGIIQSPYNITSGVKYNCENDTVMLYINPTPTPDLHIAWSNGDTINSSRVTVSGNYYAIITDSFGNSVKTPFTPVYFSALPKAWFGPDTISLCSGTLLNDTSSSELTNTYQWYFNGQLLQGENYPGIAPQQPGKYQLIVKNYCSSDTSLSYVDTLYQNPDQPVITSPAKNYVCRGDSLPLTFINKTGETYQWYTSNNFNTYIIPGEMDTVYYVHENNLYLVIATNVNGCTVQSSPKSVSFDLDQEFINLNGPSGFCQGGEVELSASQGTNFLWSRGDTVQSITVDTTGDYFVSFINKNGCPKNSDTIKITVNKNPIVYLGADTNLCSGSTLLLDAGPGYNNYFWNDGSTDQSFLATPDGSFPDTADFFVFVTDTNGCTNGDTLRIIFDICSGIRGAESDSIFIYPNPLSSHETLQIINPGNGLFTIIISDALNRKVVKKQFSGSLRLNESNVLRTGVYFYYIYKDNNTFSSGKLIVN